MAKQDTEVLVKVGGWFLGFAEKLMAELARLGVSSDDIYGFVKRGGDVPVRKIAEELAKSMRVVKETASELLEKVCAVNLLDISRFIARDHFTTNSKEVKIAWLGDNFQENFLGKVEEARSSTTLRISKLKKDSLDKPILDELGGKAETTLASIWELLKKQPNGESGKLLTNGYANIFYVRDAKGALWAVIVSWGSGGWFVNAYSVTPPREWCDGYQVFSRNS